MAGKEEIICLPVNLLVRICSEHHLFTKGCGFLGEAEMNHILFFLLKKEKKKLYLKSYQSNAPLYFSWNTWLEGVLKVILNRMSWC